MEDYLPNLTLYRQPRVLCGVRAFFLELHAELSAHDKPEFLTVYPRRRAQKMKIVSEKIRPIALLRNNRP